MLHARALEQHIRFEERTLFPFIEDVVPEEHLSAAHDAAAEAPENLPASATVTVDGDERFLEPGEATTIEKGSTRRITAGREGVRYLSVHVRRLPLQIAPPRRA